MNVLDFELDLTSLFQPSGDYWSMVGYVTEDPFELVNFEFTMNGIPVDWREVPKDKLAKAFSIAFQFLNENKAP